MNRDGGSIDEYGYGLLWSRLLSGQVVEGLEVVEATSPNMTVTVNPGSAIMPAGTYPRSYVYPVAIDTQAGESVTIPTADTSNPRIDSIVLYVDLSVTASTQNPDNPNNMLKLADVPGTPASTPAAPSPSAIQTAIGAANPYIVLANVTVGANVTQIVTSNISDQRTWATPSLGPKVGNYTNQGSAGGSGYYIDLGGLKMCWGQTAQKPSYNEPSYSLDFPSGFFTAVEELSLTPVDLSTDVAQLVTCASSTISPTSNTLFFVSVTNSSGAKEAASWFAIGT